MPVKPEFAHVREWNESRLTLVLGWDEELTTEQVLHQLVALRAQFLEMSEIKEAWAIYSAHPTKDGVRLNWRFIYDAKVVGNDSDSQRQELEQRLESTINRELYGPVVAIEIGP